MQNEIWGVGYPISRTIDGQIVRTDRLDPGIEKRMNLIAELNTQYQELLAANDTAGLIALAAKYDALKMHTMANQIRKQVNG